MPSTTVHLPDKLLNKIDRIISDHQQSWGYEEGPSKGPGPRSADGR
jgi:hypothetical protein